MVQEAEQGNILCPVCSAPTSDRTCPRCGEDLSLLQENRDLAVTSYNLGVHLAQKHRRNLVEHAMECLRLATSLKADFAEPYIVLGKLHVKQRQYSEAIACWDKALSIALGQEEPQDCLNALRKLFGGNENLKLEASWQGKTMRLGSPVQCTDGQKGLLYRIMQGDSDKISHIVVLVNNFYWEGYIVPGSLITGVDGNTVSIGARLRELVSQMPRHCPDRELAHRVSRVLSKQKPIRPILGMAMAVAATDGTVTLSGKVSSQTVKQLAEELALSVKGVLAVKNLLICDSDLIKVVATPPQEEGQKKG